MKKELFQITSDWHTEFYDYKVPAGPNNSHPTKFIDIPENSEDINLIIAGDVFCLYNKQRIGRLFDELSSRYKNIIVIAGNHEYYNSDINSDDLIEEFYDQYDNVHFLENTQIFFNGVHIFGATFWSDFNNNPQEKMQVQRGMNDFQIIKNGDRTFTPDDAHLLFKDTLHHLKSFLQYNNHNDRKIVVSHHAPSYYSVHPQYKGSPIGSGFSFDILKYFNEEQLSELKYWIHGHHHTNSDYKLCGDLRVICNPYGYTGENTKQYNRQLIIEV